MNILYLTNNVFTESNSTYRANALKRLGHNVLIENLTNVLSNNFFFRKINFDYITGYKFVQKRINNWIDINKRYFLDFTPNLIFIDSGELFGSEAIKKLKFINCPIVLLNNDDPTGPRDKNRFNSLKEAIPYYDFCFVVREQSIAEFKKIGCKNTFLYRRGYDEVMHKKKKYLEKIPNFHKSDISFVGTWMKNENRDHFIYSLIKSGLNVTIWGNRWHKSDIWNKIKPYHKGEAIYGKEYASVIQGSKISLGFLSHTNRMEITGRSYEIPYAGGLLCAERTQKHTDLYIEGYEAVFWSNIDECISVCRKLLDDNELINQIKTAGYNKIINGEFGNEKVLQKIINQVFEK